MIQQFFTACDGKARKEYCSAGSGSAEYSMYLIPYTLQQKYRYTLSVHNKNNIRNAAASLPWSLSRLGVGGADSLYMFRCH